MDAQFGIRVCIDGNEMTFADDDLVGYATRLAMRDLNKADAVMTLVREDGEILPRRMKLGDLCRDGEHLTLIAPDGLLAAELQMEQIRGQAILSFHIQIKRAARELFGGTSGDTPAAEVGLAELTQSQYEAAYELARERDPALAERVEAFLEPWQRP